jgi:molybdopterin converting factor subunit 1
MLMKVRVRLFARYRELAATGEIWLQLKPGATVLDIKTKIADLFPRMSDYAPGMMVAVNSEMVGDNCLLREGDEVALLPPISGG